MFVEENPAASLDEVLQHYGVLGMKWGKHRAKADASEIRGARHRVQGQAMNLHNAKKAASRIKDSAQREAAQSEVAKQKVAFLNNPDRVVAARLTRGEKAVGLLLGFGVAPIAVTSAASRRIERKQELGKYNK